MHFLIDRQHRGDYNQESRSACAVHVCDHCDDSRHDRDTDDIVADQLHELADDDIEHARIGDDAEEQNGEDKECSRGTGALKALLDQRRDTLKVIIAAEHQDQCENRRKENERDTR